MVCNSQGNGVRTRCAATLHHPACTKNTTRSKFTMRSIFSTAGSFGYCFREETEGRFRKKGGFGECALVPVFGSGEHPHVPSFRSLVPGNIRMYPLSGFWCRGRSAKTTLLRTSKNRGPKKQIICSSISFLAPTQNTPFWAPP